MTRRSGKAVYQYTLRFDREQLALVSQLMASTGLSMAGVIRFALVRLSKTELVVIPPSQTTPPPQESTTDAKPVDDDDELTRDF